MLLALPRSYQTQLFWNIWPLHPLTVARLVGFPCLQKRHTHVPLHWGPPSTLGKGMAWCRHPGIVSGVALVHDPPGRLLSGPTVVLRCGRFVSLIVGPVEV